MKWRVLPQAEVAADIVRQLDDVVATHKRVLLLISGGSAITHEAEVLQRLSQPERILGILPVDERYGDFGHADSNMAQLRLALPLDTTLPLVDVLEQQRDATSTLEHYRMAAEDEFSRSDAIVAVIGMGADTHTAGILPDSPAVTSTDSVVSYQWSDYQRMTLGLSLLRRVDHAFVIVYGDAKQQALDRLHENTEPLAAMPAKLLYDIPDVTIYNEHINEG